jgi:hypothetical protein
MCPIYKVSSIIARFAGRVWQAITRRQALVDGAPDLSIPIHKFGDVSDLFENSTSRGVFFS